MKHDYFSKKYGSKTQSPKVSLSLNLLSSQRSVEGATGCVLPPDSQLAFPKITTWKLYSFKHCLAH